MTTALIADIHGVRDAAAPVPCYSPDEWWAEFRRVNGQGAR